MNRNERVLYVPFSESSQWFEGVEITPNRKGILPKSYFTIR